MTPLGKPLVFHLKYMAEMNHLYGHSQFAGEKPDVTGLGDPDVVCEMARIVGESAYELAADFIELCAKDIESHFQATGITTLEGSRRRPYIRCYWEWGVWVRVPAVPGGVFGCGIKVTAPPEIQHTLKGDECGVVVPWLYAKGGRKGEDAISEVLGDLAHSRAGKGLVYDSGRVALLPIPIKPQPPGSFDVDRDPLISEVAKTFARIGAEQVKAIASFVAGLNEPDEE